MSNISNTRNYYTSQLGFQEMGNYEGYLMFQKDNIEIHFFEFKELNPKRKLWTSLSKN
jgi:hypothetical protein